ncbi:MAG: tetratricopeptide repeat protein, partial [Planctomycetota bacterium]
FVVAGVLSVGLLAIWLRRHFGQRFPWYLPPLILALSPAYLLYIRNCRYYALGVTLTLLVWIFWAPGSTRGRWLYDSPRALAGWLFRCLGAALAVVLLISTHYLNAAALLVTLPLFFFDPRYRQPRQYVIFGTIWAAAGVYGIWILATANPYAAKYGAAEKDWGHFFYNALWFVRDLGTHEFVPWVAVAAFVLPWLPVQRWGTVCPTVGKLRRLRPLALRGWILVVIVLVYAVVAAYFTPPDMGKGPTAEMRYVVPLVAVGSVLGGLAVVILWRLYRPVAVAAFWLLVMTNLLHLGFLARQFDETQPWCSPTLCRYVYETFHDYETGNEELIGLLAKLPDGTMVRVWPPHMIYPAMFYVPNLHYCDQLEATKEIRRKLVYPPIEGELPDYLFCRRARPDVWVVAPPWLREAMDALRLQRGEPRSYVPKMALPSHWYYTSKPEIPGHFFSRPETDWARFRNMTVLVASDSPLIDLPVLRTDMTDADAVCRWGLAVEELRDIDRALTLIRKAIEIDPDCLQARFHLGRILKGEGETEEAVEHLEVAVRLNPAFYEAHRDLGVALQELREIDRARYHFEKALELNPRSHVAHHNLGNILRDQGAIPRAIEHFRMAVKYSPYYVAPRVNLGSALLATGEVDEAIGHFRRALQIEPNHVEAHGNLGIALSAKAQTLDAQGKPQKARQLRNEAVKELGEALKRVPPDHSLAAELRQLLYEELRAALDRVPPDRPLAEKITNIREKTEEEEKEEEEGEKEDTSAEIPRPDKSP